MNTAAPYADLTPDLVLDAVAACGLWPDGRLLALNSYENRVWQVGIEDAAPVIAKFYRPGRWTDAAIAEEHAFAQELADAELPVVAPLRFDGHSLLRHAGYRYALSPRHGGRAPSLESTDQLEWLGRLIARMHTVGAAATLRASRHGWIAPAWCSSRCRRCCDSDLLPPTLADALPRGQPRLDEAIGASPGGRRPGAPAAPARRLPPRQRAVDRRRPAFRRSRRRAHRSGRAGPVDAGQRRGTRCARCSTATPRMREFDETELALVPVLRAMRQLHHAGWIAQRWHDPAFPLAFPFAAEARWWEQHIADLHELADELE